MYEFRSGPRIMLEKNLTKCSKDQGVTKFISSSSAGADSGRTGAGACSACSENGFGVGGGAFSMSAWRQKNYGVSFKNI